MLKRLLKEVKEFKRDSILTPVFMILEVIFEVLIPHFMGKIIDMSEASSVDLGDAAVISKADSIDMGRILLYGGIMLVLAAGALWAGIMGGKYGARACTGFARNLRRSMYRKIQDYSFANIDKFSTSSLVTRMTTDVTNVQNSYQMVLRMLTRAPANLIICMFVAITISVKVALVYLGAVVFLGLMIGLITIKVSKIFSEAFPKYDKMNESVQENVTAIRVVKGFVREEHEKKKFNKTNEMICRIFIKAESILARMMPVMQFTIYFCILMVSWVGARIIVNTGEVELSTGNLTQLLTYCMQILMSLMMLSIVGVMITMAIPCAKRIVEVLEEESAIKNPENPDYDIPDGSIEFDHVTFRYNETAEAPVLSDVNLSIKSGETIGIIGGTGSSKTSLISLISRLYDVESGAVSVGGKDVRTYDMETLRNQVAVVLQKNVLFSGTILENLRWGNKEATLAECQEACRLACADEFISKMPDGYETKLEQGGTNVSGGQRQRLCIARALLKKPRVLILDDSTSAVDTTTDAKIRKGFREFIPETTKLIIAQRISSVMDADRILVLDQGRVSGFGTHEELLAGNEIYRDVYESQQGGSRDFDEGGAQ